MYVSALRRTGLSLLGRRLGALSDGAAATFTTSATTEARPKKRDPADEFIFKEKCKGTRQLSKDAEEVNKRLRRTNFGAPRKDRTGALGAVAPSIADVERTVQPQTGGLHTAAASWASQGGSSAEDVAQELVEKGSKKLMQSDEGREELRQGSFDLDRTAERILEEGTKDASPEAAQRANEQEVKDSVKSRVVSGSQTS